MIGFIKNIFSCLFFWGILLSVVTFGESKAQIAEIEELKSKIKNEKADSTRIDMMLGLVLRYLTLNPDTSVYYAEKALVLAQKIGDTKRQAATTHQIGQSKLFNHQTAEARVYFDKALKLAESSNHQLVKAHTLASIGGIYFQEGNFDTALEHFIKSLQLYEKIKDKTGQARLSNNIANLHYDQKNYQKALQFFKKAITIKKEIGDVHTIANTYNGIADTYSVLQQYDEALSYYKKAMTLHEKNQSMKGLSISYTNIGFLHKAQKKNKEALEFYEKALAIDKKINDEEGIAINLMNIAVIYRDGKEYQKAKKNLEKSLELLRKSGMKLYIAEALKDLAELHAAMDHHQKAFTTLQAHIAIKDSVFSEQKSKQIAEMQTKYETEKKEQENKLLHSQNGRKLLLLYASLAVILVLIGLALAVIRVKQLQLRNTQATLKLKEQELISFATGVLEKDEFILEIQEELAMLQNDQNQQKVASLGKLLQARISTEDDWTQFRIDFERIYPEFFQKLRNNFPQLSGNEVKLCAIEKLGLKDIQAGDLLGVNPESVKKSRYRLRKNLEEQEKNALHQFILNYPQG